MQKPQLIKTQDALESCDLKEVHVKPFHLHDPVFKTSWILTMYLEGA